MNFWQPNLGLFPSNEGTYIQDGILEYKPGSREELISNLTTSAEDAQRKSGRPITAVVPKQIPRRRGHMKSRKGCFNCKRRRIKCQETRPACDHCLKASLNCEYPAALNIIQQPQNLLPLFSLEDMRFFQHFLFRSVPHIPLGNEGVWTHEIPCLSQNHKYLMHAILGMAASHLISEDPSLLAPAITHRLKAINEIRKAMSNASGFEERNALIAASFALLYQAMLLDDGLAEYMTFVRGIAIIANQMYRSRTKAIFSNIFGQVETATMKPFIDSLPLVRTTWTDQAVAAIGALELLCQNEVEAKYQELLVEVSQALYVDSFSAYCALRKVHRWWIMLPQEKFQGIIDLNNQVGILLSSHGIALALVVAIITEGEYRFREQPSRMSADIMLGRMRWLKHHNHKLKPEFHSYNRWPLWVEEQLDKDIDFFRGALQSI